MQPGIQDFLCMQFEGSFTSRNVVDDHRNLAIFIRNVEIFVGNSEILTEILNT